MAEIYTEPRKKVYQSTYTRYFRGWIRYELTEYPMYYVLQCTGMYFRKHSGGDTEITSSRTAKVTAAITELGLSNSGSAKGFQLDKTAPQDKQVSSGFTWTIYRMTEDKTYTINVTENVDGGSWSGTSTGSGTITIPALQQFTIDFDVNNSDTIIPSQFIFYNSTVAKPKLPYKQNYFPDKWYIDQQYTIEYDFTTSVTSDFTLYNRYIQGIPCPAPTPASSLIEIREDGENIGIGCTPTNNGVNYYEGIELEFNRDLFINLDKEEEFKNALSKCNYSLGKINSPKTSSGIFSLERRGQFLSVGEKLDTSYDKYGILISGERDSSMNIDILFDLKDNQTIDNQLITKIVELGWRKKVAVADSLPSNGLYPSNTLYPA